MTRPGTGPVPGRRGGYVLIELVATLALTGLLIGMVLPFAPLGTTPSRFLALVSASASVLRDARSAALGQGRAVGVEFDRGARRLRGGQGTVAIPRDVGFDLVAGGNCPADGRGAQIVFRPDGTSCGGLLRFRKDGRVLRAQVNWADGHVAIVQGE